MNLTGGIVLYAVLWFLTLFVLLPFGQVSQAEAGEIVPGTHSGAPHQPRIGRKMFWATMISAVLWAGCAYVILSGMITREQVMNWDQLIR
ncbi:MAG: DUF1467 family protein [Paracoccus denitrificans]|uniref:DUF1467 family protein n=1 Tax=Paracoccus denitrificans TaxID=266 RepID=A0A533IAQ8_PARDE|nr:MAG: DUF1467 family protein [Paracoccus denitrificans]